MLLYRYVMIPRDSNPQNKFVDTHVRTRNYIECCLLQFCAFLSLQEKCTTSLSIVPVVGILEGSVPVDLHVGLHVQTGSCTGSY